MNDNSLLGSLTNKDKYFDSYNYAKIYLFVAAFLTILLSNISKDYKLVEFNYTIQILLVALYSIGFIVSFISRKAKQYLFHYTFIVVTLSLSSVTYILVDNNFSLDSFFIFLITIITIIFIINTVARYLLFTISFSIIYIPGLFLADSVIVGRVNAVLVYLVLIVIAYFIVYYRVNNIKKGKSKQKIFDYFFKYSSDILVSAKHINNELIITDFNDKFKNLIGVSNREVLLDCRLDEIEIEKERIFSQIDLNSDSGTFNVELKESVIEIRYDSFLIKNERNYFIALKDVSQKVKEEIEDKLTIDSYKFLFEYSSELICISDVKGTIIDFNASLFDKIGYSKEELVGKNISFISVNEDQNKRENINRSIFENGHYASFKKEIRSKDNLIIPIEVNIRKGKYFGNDVLITTARDISDRIKSEKLLQENEQVLKQIYQNAPVMMYTEDEDGIITQVNKLFIDVIGFPLEEVIGKSFDSFLTNEFRNKYKNQRGLFKQSEYSIKCNNNNIINVIIDSINIKLSNTNKSLNLYVIQDITQLYTYQKILANSVDRFTNLFENAPIAMAIATDDNKLIDFNKSFIQLFGYEEDELINMSLYDISHKQDIPNNNEELNELKSSSSISLESRFIKKDGSTVYTIKKVLLDTDEYLKTTRKIIQIVDITPLVESRIRLDRKQEILNLTLTASQTILWDLDVSTGDAIWRNIEEVTGYSGETLLVDRAFFKRFIHPDDYEFVKYSIKEVIRLKHSYAIDFRLIRKDGSVIWINSRGEVNLDKSGNPTNIYGVMQDITQNKEYEKALELSELKYKQLFERNLSGIYRTRYDGQVIDCNYAFAEILGYDSVSEILSNTNNNNFHRDKESRNVLLDELTSNRLIISKRIQLLKKDGSATNILLSASIIYKEDNTIDYIEGNIIDINDLVLAERNLELTKQQYKNLIDHSSFGILILLNKKVQFINSKGINILEYSNEKELIGKYINEIIGFENNLLDKDINFVELGNLLGVQDRVFINNKNKRLDVEVRINTIKYNEKDCILITFIDITSKKQIDEEKKRAELAETSNALLKAEIKERIKVENQLTLAQSYTNGIIESSIDMIYTAGINGSINEFNTAAVKEFGYKKSEIIGQSLNILFAYEKECNDVISKLEDNGQFIGEVVSKRKNNSLFISYLSVSYLFNTNGVVMGIMAISRDVTELKLAEEELRNSEERNKLQAAKLKTVIESSSHYFFTIDKLNRIISFNTNFRNDVELLNNTSVQENDDFFKVMGITNKKEITRWKNYFKIGFSGEHFHFENMQFDTNNKPHYKEIFINPIKKENGEIDELSFIGRDITEKIIADKKLKESLKQKEILLKEVHHRVKNNMQVISSILNLQSAYVKDVKTLQILKESQNRIKSMSFIHESLYTNEDFSRIDFSDYITNLVRNLFRTYDVFDDNITLDLQIDKIYLNLDSAIPCGLIVNELISNSLKYAFDVKSGGIIKIMLTLENDLVVLAIGDNGRGIPKDLDIENTETLGLQLISSLVEQLEGEMTLDRDNGANFIIKFEMN